MLDYYTELLEVNLFKIQLQVINLKTQKALKLTNLHQNQVKKSIIANFDTK